MRQILRQTFWLILAQTLTRIVGFFYTIFLAKNLGVSDFGLLTVVLAYFSIISSVADFGFNRFLVREVVRNEMKTSELLCNVVMLRLAQAAILFAVFAIFLYNLDPDKIRVSLILLAVLAILPQSVALTFDSIFMAFGKLQFSAVALILSSLLTTLAGLYLVTSGFGVMGAINALIFGQLIFAATQIFLLFRNFGLLLANIKLSIIKKAIIGSLPYGLLGVLGLLYFKIDAVLLSYLRGNFETGLYGVAYRFLEAIIFVPGAFAVAFFPKMAKLHDENLAEVKKLYFSSLKLMVVLGVTLMLGYLFILPLAVLLFLPQFLQALAAIKILSLSIPFIFLATPGVQVLLSTEKYLKGVIVLSFLTVAVNIVLNLLFIPKFGFLAAAWITVLSDVLSFIIFYLFITRKIFSK